MEFFHVRLYDMHFIEIIVLRKWLQDKMLQIMWRPDLRHNLLPKPLSVTALMTQYHTLETSKLFYYCQYK